MKYQPGPTPLSLKELPSHVDRELRRIAQSTEDYVESNGVLLGGIARIVTGTGSPESVVTARVGSLYLRQDGGAGTTLYVKESGTSNTGWVPK